MNLTPFRSALLAAALVVGAAPRGHATLLIAGQNLTPGIAISGTNIGDPGDLRGTVVVTDLVPFSFSGVSGGVTNYVIQQADNTYGFAWIISLDVTSQPLEQLRIGNFGAPFPLYGDFLLTTVGHAPDHIATFTDGLLNFLFFDSQLQAGETSSVMYLNPHARGYTRNVAYDLTAGNNASGAFTTFGPGAVPEPSAFLLAASGAVLLALRRRVRQLE
jgi:hypothetical protein